MRLQHFAPFLAAAFFVGCATSPISNSEAKEVGQSRLLSNRYGNKRENCGEVLVKRDRGIMGSACSSRVFVNAEAVADLRVGEKVTLFLPVGDHIISSKPNGICGGGLAETSVSVVLTRPISLRIRYGSNGDYTIQPTAF
ncbi:MAG: hypothetical protein WCS99_20880 [Limisphaerales bacterium]